MDVGALLDGALGSRDDHDLRATLLDASRLPGPRMDLSVVAGAAAAVARCVLRPDPPVDALEVLLDGWAALTVVAAPGDRPEVILPCVAAASYGAIAVARPDWWADEVGKLRRAAADPRWRVREVVAQALQRMLDHDWPRALGDLDDWAADADADPLGLRAVAAAVAQPRLLRDAGRASSAAALERRVVARYRALTAGERRTESAVALRQALGFTLSVTVAATSDPSILDELVASEDADLRWIGRRNLATARVRRLMAQE